MKILDKRPGEILLLGFVIGGITLTLAATVAEMASQPAGRVPGHAFDSGIIDSRTNGSSWDAAVHGK